MNFTILGEPISKMRHRKGKKGMYDPQSDDKKRMKYELSLRILTEHPKFRTELPFLCAIRISMSFYFPYPKKLSQKKINAILENREKYTHIIKPDIDNLVKFYLDVGNGILYKDDKQIICLLASKHYDLNPRVEINITTSKEKLYGYNS